MKKTRVLILGGGFGGLYAALEFEKRRDPDFVGISSRPF
jgi:NADH dehydrogenase FAD-containing subunit